MFGDENPDIKPYQNNYQKMVKDIVFFLPHNSLISSYLDETKVLSESDKEMKKIFFEEGKVLNKASFASISSCMIHFLNLADDLFTKARDEKEEESNTIYTWRSKWCRHRGEQDWNQFLTQLLPVVKPIIEKVIEIKDDEEEIYEQIMVLLKALFLAMPISKIFTID